MYIENRMSCSEDNHSSSDSVEVHPHLLEQIRDNAQNQESPIIHQMAQNGYSTDGQPYLQITEQPLSRGYRFRYKCEGTSHGGLQGENSDRSNKTYPSVKICGYTGPARITVTLVTDEDIPKPHAHELVGKHCTNGVCIMELKGTNMEAMCSNLSIQHVTKKKVVNILIDRILESMKVQQMLQTGGGYDETRVNITAQDKKHAKKQAEEQAKTMQLNVLRLCFQAYLQDENGCYSRMLPSVVSQPIYDCKSPGAAALKICRMDKQAGCCTGKDEVFLLCDKVQKDDISVRFYELDDKGLTTWEGHGTFGPADVHKQYAIVFKTPPYRDTSIEKPVNVFVQLQRINDHETSDPKPFTYYPQPNDQDELKTKKKKVPTATLR